MPIFVSDDSAPSDLELKFFEIDRTRQGIVIGSLEVFQNEYGVFPETLSYGFSATRVRSDFGGGFYPASCRALIVLQEAIKASHTWGDTSPLAIANDGDVLITNHYDMKSDVSIPYKADNTILIKYPEIERAFENVLDAMRQESGKALGVLSKLQSGFAFRRSAEDRIKTFCAQRPASRSQVQEASKLGQNSGCNEI